MPSRSTVMAIAWTLGAIAVISRVPQGRALLFGA